MKKGTKFALVATDVSTYVTSPFHLYCNYFADSLEKDPSPDLYLKQLAKAGMGHEQEINEEQFPGSVLIRADTLEDGFKAVLDSMIGGTKAFISAPLFYLPDGMYGVADQLVRAKGKSAFGSYHYTIKEIKVAKNIKISHILQAAFYNHIIGKIQGYTPETFHVINMEKKEHEFSYEKYKPHLFQVIEKVKGIRNGDMPSPTFGSCGYPWENYCNKMAMESRDISLISGIGQKKKEKFAGMGLKKIDDILERKSELESMSGIGKKTAKNYAASAEALDSGKTVRKSNGIIFPQKTTEIFLDMEGLDELGAKSIGYIQADYMIGALVRKNGLEKYLSFIAHSHDREKAMLDEFLGFIKNQDDYAIYHWHNYEKRHLGEMMDKYGVPQHDRKLVLSEDILFDLHKIATDQFAFPLPNTGIKSIAKYLGYSWKHPDVGALSSIELYMTYVKTADKRLLELILDYNRDDCEAAKIIKDWLVQSM